MLADCSSVTSVPQVSWASVQSLSRLCQLKLSKDSISCKLYPSRLRNRAYGTWNLSQFTKKTAGDISIPKPAMARWKQEVHCHQTPWHYAEKITQITSNPHLCHKTFVTEVVEDLVSYATVDEAAGPQWKIHGGSSSNGHVGRFL